MFNPIGGQSDSTIVGFEIFILKIMTNPRLAFVELEILFMTNYLYTIPIPMI